MHRVTSTTSLYFTLYYSTFLHTSVSCLARMLRVCVGLILVGEKYEFCVRARYALCYTLYDANLGEKRPNFYCIG